MQRMHVAVRLDGALRRHQRLRDRLAAKDALPALLGTATTIQVVFELLEVENGEELLHGQRHVRANPGWAAWACRRMQQEQSVKSSRSGKRGDVHDGEEDDARQHRNASSTCLSRVPAMSAWQRRWRSSRRGRISPSASSMPRPKASGNATAAPRRSPPLPAACSAISAAGTRSRRVPSRSPR